MEVINVKDLCIPADDASYDELSDFAYEIAELATYPIVAEPVRRGRWIYNRCSLCGQPSPIYKVMLRGETVWEIEGANLYYCPNCGAKMEEQE